MNPTFESTELNDAPPVWASSLSFLLVAGCVSAGIFPARMRLAINSSTTGSTCGGNCPSGSCPSCPCGETSNYLNIADWCAKATNGWNQANCQCIMQHESGGNANAMHENSDGSGMDVGLWQIDDYNWDFCSNGSAPCDPNANLACAMDVYMWGDNTWKFWVTCSMCGCCDSP